MHDQTSDEVKSNEPDNSKEEDEEKVNNKSDVTPYFVSSLQDSDMIPCLKSG